jgi:hypothetical protein
MELQKYLEKTKGLCGKRKRKKKELKSYILWIKLINYGRVAP